MEKHKSNLTHVSKFKKPSDAVTMTPEEREFLLREDALEKGNINQIKVVVERITGVNTGGDVNKLRRAMRSNAFRSHISEHDIPNTTVRVSKFSKRDRRFLDGLIND